MVNKIKILLLYILFIVNNIYSQNDISSIFSSGIDNLKKGNIEEAISKFSGLEKLISKDDSISSLNLYFMLLTCYKANNQHNLAISYGERILMMDNISQEVRNEVNLVLLSSYYDSGNIKKAEDTAHEIESYIDKIDIAHLKFDSVIKLVSYYYNIPQKFIYWANKAEMISVNVDDLSENQRITYFVNLNTLYLYLIIYYNNLSDYNNVILYGEKALVNIVREVENNKLILYSALSKAYLQIGKIDEGKKYAYKAFELVNVGNSIKDEDFELVGEVYQLLADILVEEGKLIESIDLYKNAIEYFKKDNKNNLLYYCNAKLYYVYNKIGNSNEANIYKDVIIKNIKNIKNIKKQDNETYAILLSTYGSILLQEGKVEKSLEVYRSVISLYENGRYKDSRNLITAYTKIANALRIKRDYKQARVYIDKAIKILSENKSFEYDYINSIMSLSDIAYEEGNIGEAISLLESIKLKIEGLHEDFSFKHEYYTRLDNLNEYVNNSIKIDSIYTYSLKRNEGEKSRNYAILLINKSVDFFSKGEYLEAVNICQKALDILEENNLTRTKEYYEALNKQAYNMIHIDTTKTKKIIDLSLSLAIDLFGENSIEYGESLITSVFLSPSYLKKDLSVFNTFINAINIKRKAGADNTMEYFIELNILSTWYAYVFKDYESAYQIDKELFEKCRNFVKDNFCHLRDSQRIGLWNHLKKELDGLIQKATDTFNPEFAKLAYNETLLRKNLLLNSNTSIRSIILNSGDDDAILALEKYLLSKKNSYSINELENLERNIIHIAQSFGIITDFINIDWTDIRNSLLPNEIAIEFIEYPCNDGSMNYLALVLMHNSYEPILIPIFNSNELKYYKNKDTVIDYNSTNLYKIIWNRLEKYFFNDIKTVFFSADGLLHKIAIENLKDTNGTYAYEKWNLVRLSSTRKIINRNIKRKANKYILYGGLDYDSAINDKKTGVNTSSQRCIDYDSFRSGFGKLIGTKIEVDEIAKILKGNAIDYELLQGSNGTEESFKKLSNSDYNVIHLATHGFFWSKKEFNSSKIKYVNNDNYYNQTIIDDALCRSGIALSGCNNIINGVNIPRYKEDGILTGDEISTINLNNVDMVVLSACNTGLGEYNSEGVFGLQRGFKLAGANTLLMSLWNVSDDATQLFMTEFYKSLFSGKSKQEALDYAKKYLIGNGYNDPCEWAAWILLDGI